jgi:DtxR family transcriptional regulator, Mn-dependent transcriptional regulator
VRVNGFVLPHVRPGANVPGDMITRATEDYLKAIYQLSQGGEPVGTSAIADRLGVAAGSVTGMLKRLGEQGYVEHVPYYGARLTDRGREQAVALVRRHRVLELFLVEVLGFGWDQVHEEAERLEHAASDRLIDHMDRVLGQPEFDPHGAPIPAPGVDFRDDRLPSLADVETGHAAILRRVPDEDPEALRYLARLNLVPGVEVEVLERAPFGGPVRVRVGREEQLLGPELTARLEVELLEES